MERRAKFVKEWFWFFTIIWSIVIILSLAWNIYQRFHSAIDQGRSECLSAFKKDMCYRVWNAREGGVYVLSEKTPPNPYLKVPNRDVVTTNGLKLTLVNPAYMTRMVHKLGAEKYGLKGHITSLKVLNPINAPDPWEKKALLAFQEGKKEVLEIVDINGKRYLRFMKPLTTEKPCLKCHTLQGYQIGDIRGGISVTLPLVDLLSHAYNDMMYITATHLLLFILGLGGIIFAEKNLNKHFNYRLKAERRLAQEREQLAITLRSIGDGVIVTNKEGQITMLNNAAEKITEWSQNDAVGKDIEQVFNVRKINQENDPIPIFEKVLDRKETIELPGTILISKNQAKRIITAKCSPIINNTEELIGIIIVFTDITEKKKMEKLLNESLANLRVLSENAPFGLSIISTSGSFEYVNPKFLEIFNCCIEDLTHLKAWINAVSIDTESKSEIREIFHDPQSTEKTITLKCKNKIEKTIRFKCVRLNDNRKILCCEDITETKRLEQQLKHAQKMEAIGRLAGGIAHDFNNLLTTITGFSDLILLGLDEADPIRQDLEQIRMSASRAASLTRQLLMFSRKEVSQPEILNLNKIVRDMDKMLRRIIGEDIELVTITNPNLGFIRIDPGQMEQIIMNLVINARDAMPEGGKLIIETENVELNGEYQKEHADIKPGQYVMLVVTDTGFGIEEDIIDKIFDPFFTTKDITKGTGLGLSTVYGIVKQNRGHISVYSEPGIGTTFKIYLPRVKEKATQSDEVFSASKSLQGAETILLVEDDPSVRKLAYRVLTQSGYQVLEASYGDEAISIVNQFPGKIHLVISDIVMPQMSGTELAEKLKTLQKDIKIIFMSGYTNNTINHDGILDKGVNFIQKPFTVDTLLRKVREVLENSRERRS